MGHETRICQGIGCENPLAPSRGKPRKWCSERCRKRTLYGGTCEICGARTDGTASGKKPVTMCRPCATTKFWTRERILEAIRTWADERGGIPPKSMDWGNGESDRHPDFVVGVHPHAQVVAREFGSFNKGLEAAGFEPHMRRDVDRFTPDVVEKVKARLRRGDATADIAVDLGVTNHNLIRCLHYRGISIRDLATTARRAQRDEANRAFCDAWRSDRPVAEVAAQFGLTPRTARQKASRLGVRRRS